MPASEFTRPHAVTLLNAVSANGTGPSADLGTVYGDFTVEVETSGTVSAFSVQVQGSLDSVAWENVGSAITATTAGEAIGTGVLLQYFQATLSGYSGSGTVTVELAYSLESSASGGGGPGVTGVTAGDASIIIGGTTDTPTVETATLDEIATLHPPVNPVAMNGQPLSGESETLQTVSSASGTVNLAAASYNVFAVTLAGATTFTFGSVGSGVAWSFSLYVTENGTGGYAVTWPGSVTWVGGTPPTLNTAANAVNLLVFESVNGGTTWYGSLVTTAPSLPLSVTNGGTGLSAGGVAGTLLTGQGTSTPAAWQGLFSQTAVQTTTCTVAAGTLVPCDTSGASFTATLAAAPFPGAMAGVKQVNTSGSNQLTFACGGTDVFNKIYGGTASTSFALPLQSQGALVQYAGAGAAWSFTGTSSTANLTISAGPAFAVGNVIYLAGGSLPAGLAANTRYYVVASASTTFQVSATYGGSAITPSGSGSGTAQTCGTWLVISDDLPLGQLEALFAPLASPALTGSPTAPTQSASDNSTKLATTAFVTTAVKTGAQAAPAGFTPANPTAWTNATLVMMGLGSSCTYTPSGSGLVVVTITCYVANSSSDGCPTGARYGTGTAPAAVFSATCTNGGGTAPGVFTSSGPGYASGTQVILAGTAPSGFTAGTTYFVVSPSGNTFELSATLNGSAINSDSTGSGIAFGIPAAGARIGAVGDPTILATAASPGCFATTGLLTLTPGTPCWFDVAVNATGAHSTAITDIGMTMFELP